jgi:putative ABC transport system substrate-binding protein
VLRPGLFLAVIGAALSQAAATAPRPAGHPHITALLSQDAGPYRAALEGFQDELKRSQPSVEVVVHVLAPGKDQSALVMLVRGEEPSLVLALGSAAAEAARQIGEVPVVASLVLRATDVLIGSQFTGVFLEFPSEVEFRYLARILPGQHRVAVIYNAAQNQRTVEEARRAARASGLELVLRKVTAPSDIPATLLSLSNNAEVLWGLADTIVLTPETAGRILLFSLQNRIPFVGLSAPWVRAGAVYALERDYGDIGRQCAEMASLLLDGASPSDLTPVPPRKVLYLINQHTATQLRLSIPRDVLRGADKVIE